MKKNLLISIMAIGLVGITFAVINNQQKKPWPIPDSNKNMKNTVASNAGSIADGKALYSTHCKSCHGTKGLGDGTKASELKTEPGDFSRADVQSQTDGTLLYKLTEGRDDMPTFKKKIPDADERWSIVNYLRTFKK